MTLNDVGDTIECVDDDNQYDDSTVYGHIAVDNKDESITEY